MYVKFFRFFRRKSIVDSTFFISANIYLHIRQKTILPKTEKIQIMIEL